MRLNTTQIIGVIGLIVLPICCVHDMALKASAQAPPTPQAMVERLNLSAVPDAHGPFIPYRNFAAYEWIPGTETPTRLDSQAELKWKIIAEGTDGKHQFVYFWSGKFRQASGNPQATPVRWAYLRLQPEVWHPTWGQWVLPGTVVPPVPPSKPGVHIDAVAGQQLIDILKRSFTTAQIQDFIDASPYDEPDTGAPETPGAMG